MKCTVVRAFYFRPGYNPHLKAHSDVACMGLYGARHTAVKIKAI